MPVNNNLRIEKLPMELRFGQKAKTEVKNLEEGINVTAVDFTPYEQVLDKIGYCKATWNEDPFKEYTKEEKEENLINMFTGKTLPTVLETIRFTFLLEGLTYVEISHILRYRGASFSALCTADRDQRNDNVAIPSSIEQSSQFKDRYIKLMNEMKDLYAEMVDTKEISIFDARYVLPKAATSYYYMSMNFRDIMHFIKQRIDRSIQPQTDNILAYKMWLEVCKAYPILTTLNIVNFDEPSWFFIKTHTSGHASNIYLPEEHNAKHFEYNEKSFMYNKTRPEMCGMDKDAVYKFDKIKKSIEDEIEKIKEDYLKSKHETSNK